MPRLNDNFAFCAICAFFTAQIWLNPAPVFAQASPSAPPAQDGSTGNDITDIIRDILGDTTFPSFPGAPGSEPSVGIDNIPVSLTIEASSDAPDISTYENGWLVVSAYSSENPESLSNSRGAPAQARETGTLLGQTRLLLRGLTPPYNIVIAAPRAVTSELEFARIEGRIEDSNGTEILTTPQAGYYSGSAPAALMLSPVLTLGSPALPPETLVKFETAQGEISIPKDSEIFRGAVLTVQLIEAGLVGGTRQNIKGESRMQLDALTPPYAFKLDYGVPESGFKMPLTLSAFITNWAGRKTHVMAESVDFNGPDFNYRLTLDAYRLGGDVADFRFSDSASAAKVKIEGLAVFNAYKGLPLGSYLQVKLKSPIGPNGQPQDLGTTAISLDGRSGNVDFMIDAPSVNFDPELPNPFMEVKVFNSLGNALFQSDSILVMPGAKNIITLSPLTIY